MIWTKKVGVAHVILFGRRSIPPARAADALFITSTPLSVLFLFLFRQSHVLASRKIRKLSFEQCKHRVLHRVVLEVFDLVSAGSIQGCGVSVRGLFVL